MGQATRILAALVVGLAIGVLVAANAAGFAPRLIAITEPVGTAWLNALRMTIVPLVVALLVTGIASTATAARASTLAARSIVTFIVILWISTAIGTAVMLALLEWFPLSPASAEGLRGSFAGAGAAGDVPGFGDFLVQMVPTNPIQAAATDSFLPLIVFTLVFAFAVTRLPDQPRATMLGFFRALQDVMLIMIGWVLWIAPAGVFALAAAVGARMGVSAVGTLLHYIVLVASVGVVISLFAYPVAVFGGRLRLGAYVRAIIPSQAVALSTQSSLASLPAMLGAAERLGVPVERAGVTLPLAVALFRVTGPAMNMAVALYVAHVFGIELTPAAIAAGIVTSAITTLGSVSLPGQISFVAAIAPIALAMGVPIEPLALLVAVETLPDIVRTVGNVMMDVAVTTSVARSDGAELTESDAVLSETLP